MRKGPLDRYSVEEILGQAAAEGCKGGIEIQSTVSGTIYLTNGYVYFVTIDGTPVPSDVVSTADPSKETMRHHVEAMLCGLVEATTGWYHYDPQNTHPDGVRWVFQIDGLVRSVRARLERDRAVRPWGAGAVDLATTDSDRIRLTTDMWNVVVAMAMPMSSHQLSDRLGWDASRLAAALRHLADADLLAAGRSPVVDAAHAATAIPARETTAPGTAPELERVPVAPASDPVADLPGWQGTPDLTPRRLHGAGGEPTRRGAGVGVDTLTRTVPVASASAARGAPRPDAADPPRSTETVMPPPVAGTPTAADDGGRRVTRKSALKRLIGSLRQ